MFNVSDSHCSCTHTLHPQLEWMVEQMNRTINRRLSKVVFDYERLELLSIFVFYELQFTHTPISSWDSGQFKYRWRNARPLWSEIWIFNHPGRIQPGRTTNKQHRLHNQEAPSWKIQDSLFQSLTMSSAGAHHDKEAAIRSFARPQRDNMFETFMSLYFNGKRINIAQFK